MEHLLIRMLLVTAITGMIILSYKTLSFISMHSSSSFQLLLNLFRSGA